MGEDWTDDWTHSPGELDSWVIIHPRTEHHTVTSLFDLCHQRREILQLGDTGHRAHCHRLHWVGPGNRGLCAGSEALSQAILEGACLSTEVQVLSLKGSNKFPIQRGCLGLPGASGLKGHAGDPGKKVRYCV